MFPDLEYYPYMKKQKQNHPDHEQVLLESG